MDGTVKASLVCQRLKAHIISATRWERSGDLVRIKRGEYLIADVDAFLKNGARNFDKPPTWDDLDTGRIVLLHPEEAMAQFNIKKERLDGLRRSKHVAYIKFPGGRAGVRYCLATMTKVLGGDRNLITLSQTVRILARPIANVRRLIEAGKLERVFNPHNPMPLHVSHASLAVFLGTQNQLPPWVTPEEWIADCLSTDKPLVGAPEILAMLDIRRRFLPRLLRRHKVWFIRVPRRDPAGRIKISPVWLETHDELKGIYSPEDVARLFSVEVGRVHTWAADGLIVCPLPAHDHSNSPFLWEMCWAAYLERQSSPYPRSLARFHIHVRKRFNTKLLNAREFAGQLLISEQEVIALAQEGTLRGIKTPDGTWRFSANQVVKARQHLQGRKN